MEAVMLARVRAEICQGHTLCALAAPEVIMLDDEDGHASIAIPEVPVAQEDNVRTAAATCPERAIELTV